MATALLSRLEDWQTWVGANHQRLPLYYQQRGILETRDRFLTTCISGLYELMSLVLEAQYERYWLEQDAVMPLQTARQIQQDVIWFNQHKDTINDYDTRWDFLMRAVGLALRDIKLLGDDLGLLAPVTEGEDELG